MRVLLGTASWSDPEFIRDWYPRNLPARDRLRFYAEHFAMVEVNSTFYAIPAKQQTAQWAKITPPGFTFNVKLHKSLSRHACDLKQLPRDLQERAESDKRGRLCLTPEIETEIARRFVESVRPLAHAGKLAVLLLQLSPSFSPNDHALNELDPLLDALADHRVVVELRHRGWIDNEERTQTLRYLSSRHVSLVSIDGPASRHFMVMPELDEMTNPDTAYLRLHGRNERGFIAGRSVAERFDYNYSDAELQDVRNRVTRLARQAREVHVVFNNNHSDYAPRNAEALRRLLGQTAGAASGREPTQGELPL